MDKYTKNEPENKRSSMSAASGSPSFDDRFWMRKALDLAHQAAAAGEVPVGCVIVLNGRLVGQAHNRVEMDEDVTSHAEILALRQAQHTVNNKYLHGCTLYVTLEPCPMCAGALVWSKIDRIVFGALDAKAGACGTLFNISTAPQLNHRISVTSGVLEDDCERLLKDFFASRRDVAQRR